MRNIPSLLAVMMTTAVLLGCAQAANTPATKAVQKETSASTAPDVAVPPTIPAAQPATPEEYFVIASRSGKEFTPEPGSDVRQELMDALREYLDMECMWVVHSLSVQGEIAEGRVEPYPQDSYPFPIDVTWVLWRGSWQVVSAVRTPGNNDSTTSPPYNNRNDSGVQVDLNREWAEMEARWAEQRVAREEQARTEEEALRREQEWAEYCAAYEEAYSRTMNSLASRGMASTQEDAARKVESILFGYGFRLRPDGTELRP